MFQLIESQSREMKEVLSDRKIVYQLKEVELPVEETFSVTYNGFELFIRGVPRNFGKLFEQANYMEVDGARFNLKANDFSYYESWQEVSISGDDLQAFVNRTTIKRGARKDKLIKLYN